MEFFFLKLFFWAPQIHKSSNPQIHKFTNPQIHKSTNPQIHKSTNPQIKKSKNSKINKSANPQIKHISSVGEGGEIPDGGGAAGGILPTFYVLIYPHNG